MNTDELVRRLDGLERQLRLVQHEVDAIRLELAADAPPSLASFSVRPAAPHVREPIPSASERLRPFPPRPTTARPARTSAPPTSTAAAPPVPKRPRRELDLTELLGARALAWAGGVVTLLGVVFFFVLAANRGWIGPGIRVGLGAAASAIVFASGIWLRRRFGDTYSSLAAVGTGIAGAYATLLAATALYDLISKPFALAAATAVAAAALAVSLLWREEIVAALGLVGAIVAPAFLATQGGVTATGVGFAALMTVAAAIVGVRMRWHWLLTAAALASAPQVVALVFDAHRNDVPVTALAFGLALLYLVTGIAEQLASRSEALAPLPTAFVLGSIGLTWLTAARMFGPAGGTDAGIALLAAAVVFGVVASAVRYRNQFELATLLGTIALAAAAVGTANVLSGPSLAYTFAAQAAILAVTARRVRELRLELGALAYLVLAAGHALMIDAKPDSLFEVARHPASGAPALAAVAVAALILALTTQADWNDSSESGVLRFLAPVVDALRSSRRELRVSASVVAALLAADALSLALLELFEAAWRGGGVVASFHRGEVAVTGLWALGGLVAVVVATRLGSTLAQHAGFAWLAVTALKVTAYDAEHLVGLSFSLAFVVLAAALLLAAFLSEVLDARRLSPTPETFAAIAGAAVLAAVSIHPLDGTHARGWALLAISIVFGTFAASVFLRARLRDLSTLLWAIALVFAAAAAAFLVGGVWLVLAWAGAAAVLAVLALALREPRFQLASLVYLAIAAAATLGHEATPAQLVVARAHPGQGVPAVLILIGAVLTFAWAARNGDGGLRPGSLWCAGVLAVYAASLTILELAVRVSGASLHTDFQRGQTAVSALWGALGLALLYVGLRRHERALRLGGLTLFGISLGKLFLYDLSQLSSITRALSFLAVGAILLLAGFFTQRLNAMRDEETSPPLPH